MKLLKHITRNDVIMFFLLGVSAFPFFSSNQPFTILFAVGLIALFFTNKPKQTFDSLLLIILLAIFTCVLFQAVIFSYFKMITIFGLLMKILTAYFAIKLLGEDFINSYLRIMIFLSIISLVIFIPVFIHPSLLGNIIDATPSFLTYQLEIWGIKVDRKTLILYNLAQETVGLVRNNGAFWEPGAFGGFLTIAIIFNTIQNGRLSNKVNWLFFITVISTQSTTAYLALFAFVICFLLVQNYSRRAKSWGLVFGVAGFIAFQTIPFLGAKIQDQNASAQDDIESKEGDTRIASAILDWNDIKGYPLSGRGIWPETRIDKKYEFAKRNNGFTNFLAEWGFLFFIIYFFYYYEGFSIFCKINNAGRLMPVIILAIIWLVSSGEDYFGLQFFWALVFLSIPLKKYYYREGRKIEHAIT